MPSTDTIVILTFSGEETVVDSTRPDQMLTCGAMVTGIWNHHVWSSLTPEWSGIQVNLPPVGAFAVLQQPLSDLASRVVDLADVFGPEASVLLARLAETADWEARFGLLDAFLLSRIRSDRHVAPVVKSAWQRIATSQGRLPIEQVAREVGCSRGHLWRRFRQEIGVSPKEISRIVRFRGALIALAHAESPDVSRVAQECGFADQSHLNRDFRELAGFTPSAAVRGLLI